MNSRHGTRQEHLAREADQPTRYLFRVRRQHFVMPSNYASARLSSARGIHGRCEKYCLRTADAIPHTTRTGSWGGRHCWGPMPGITVWTPGCWSSPLPSSVEVKGASWGSMDHADRNCLVGRLMSGLPLPSIVIKLRLEAKTSSLSIKCHAAMRTMIGRTTAN